MKTTRAMFWFLLGLAIVAVALPALAIEPGMEYELFISEGMKSYTDFNGKTVLVPLEVPDRSGRVLVAPPIPVSPMAIVVVFEDPATKAVFAEAYVMTSVGPQLAIIRWQDADGKGREAYEWGQDNPDLSVATGVFVLAPVKPDEAPPAKPAVDRITARSI